jgi:hypothetical protein
MMKTILGAASAIALLLSTQSAIAHDEKAKVEVEKSYELSGFAHITVEGVYHLDIEVGESFSVQTSGSKKDMAKIEVYVEDGSLVLGMKDNKGGKIRGQNNHGVNAIITLPKLDGIEIAGVATGEVSDIDAGRFTVEFAGVGELSLNGNCDDLEFDMAGVGEVDASDLKCENVEVNLAGMGEASVYASESVDANAAGIGQINVYGKPDVVQKSSVFMSSVKIK